MAHGRRSGFAKKIDTVHWTLVQEASASAAVGIVAFNALAAQHLPETLMRIRGEWACGFAGALASQVGVAITGGLIQVPEGTGTTALWSPVTDGDAPWIWWDTIHFFYAEQVADVVANSPGAFGRRVIDSKAMRKMRNTELQFVIQRVTISGMSTGNTDVSLTARVLAGS